jgi:hypothetical protein
MRTAPSIGWLRRILLAFHGEEIAVEHGRGFDEGLGERHRRQLDGKAAGLPDAALDVFRPLAQMAVAGVDVAPGVEDADHRLAGPVGAVIAELPQSRAMAEGAQIVGTEPAVAAQSLGRFFLAGGHGRDRFREKSSTHYLGPGGQREMISFSRRVFAPELCRPRRHNGQAH